MAALPERDVLNRDEQELRNEEKRVRFFGDVRELRAIDQQNARFGDLRVRHGSPEPAIPGLGPTFSEVAAQRRIDTAQALQIPERRETDRAPIVGQPERMSEAMNARLFPTGPTNDDDRGR